MTTYQQMPGRLDIEVGLGGDFSMLIPFKIGESPFPLTGYTFESKVDGVAITVTNTDLASGQITLSLTDTQVIALGAGKHTWYLIWTLAGISQRVFAGGFSIKETA